jgi:hypothetical protein
VTVEPARWPFCEMRARDEAARSAVPVLGDGRKINLDGYGFNRIRKRASRPEEE